MTAMSEITLRTRPLPHRSALDCAIRLAVAPYALRIALAFLAITLPVMTVTADAEDAPRADATPIEFSVGPIKYRVPRNVLLKTGGWAEGPQIEVEYPTARPTKERNEVCPHGQSPCKLIKVTIFSPRMTSMDEGFEHTRKTFNKTPKKGPFGYEFFDVGPDLPFRLFGDRGAIIYYRKVEGERKFAFVCNEWPEHVPPCHAYSRTSSGGVVRYSFSPDLLQDIDQFDAKLRELVDSFVIAGAQ